MKKITPAVNDLFRVALHYAIADRESFVAAHNHMKDDPAAVHAAELVKKFKLCLKKRYGEIPVGDAPLGGKVVNIRDLLAAS